MMRIAVSPERTTPTIIETASGTLTLPELLRYLSLVTGVNSTRAGYLAGLDHSTEYQMRHGRNNALKPLIAMLDAWGYDVIIKKREGHD